MKKQKYPNPSEVEELIAEAERLAVLDHDRTKLTKEISELDRELRSNLCSFIRRGDNTGVATNDHIKHYKRLGGNSPRIEAQIEALESVSSQYENLQAELKKRRPVLVARSHKLCAICEGAKQAEYKSLLGEITQALKPFCLNDLDEAEAMAKETPAALASFEQIKRCWFTLYGRDDVINPLKAVLEFAQNA